MDKKKKLENKLYKTTEKILYNYVFLDININSEEKELESFELDLKGMYAELADYERNAGVVTGGGFSSGISNTVEKKILRKEKLKTELIPNLEAKIDKKLNKINRDKSRMRNIEIAINNLDIVDSRAKQIIELYFIQRRKVSDICDIVHLEDAQIHRLKSLGIKAIRNHIFGFDALEEEDNLISMLKVN